jgi:type IX secretion system PorP/SprF family membrane protein
MELKIIIPMKKLFISAAFLIAGFNVSAQQDAQFTQNMFNKLSTNPGSAGHNGGFCATLLTRSQWMGFEGKPETYLFSGDAKLGKHGVGLTVSKDKLGIESTLIVKGTYAYHLTSLGPGELGIGIDIGLVNKSFGNNFVAIDDPTLDPSIPNDNTSSMSFDAGLGLYYEIKDKLYVGISSLHLPQAEIEDLADNGGVGALNYASTRHYYIMAGYDWDATNGARKWVIKPSLLAKTDATSTQLDLNVLALYNNMLWGGVTYRIQDALAILAGIDFTKINPSLQGLKLGVSYDLTTSAIGDHSSGSLEFMLRYCMNIVKPTKREVYHSVRFL